MGLRPSIRSLLAAGAGFTTGNGEFLPERTLALPTLSSHLASPLELNNSFGHTIESKQPLCLEQGFCLVICFPSRSWFEAPCHPPSPFPAWRNRLLSDTCAVHQVARDLAVGTDVLGLINIKSFRMVRSSR